MKRVLVLGAGLVARPLVRYLLDRGHHVALADIVQAKAEAMLAGHPHGEARTLDLADEARLAAMVEGSDLAVSLVPFVFHPVVARACVRHRRPMVTTSYVSDAMKALDAEARAAGVVLLNEIGVDPGVDHMSAMRVIDDVRRRGGRITAFRSYCGGLPAPEANDNPFGYKFSWAPRGVLLAGRNEARYRLDGRDVVTPNARLFRDTHMLHVEDFGHFEAYPNRDSISYIEIYGLGDIDTLQRLTLRNPGWCDTLHNFIRLGLLGLEEVDARGLTYADFTRRLVGAGPADDVEAATARALGLPREALPVANLRWLGMFSDRPIGADRISPLDALGALMFERLAFREGERDLLVLYHDFRAVFPDGHRERIVSKLIDFGIPGGDSAMSRTVSLPAAIAVDRILAGKFDRPGVHRPVMPELYEPVLDGLAELGIRCEETSERY